MMYVRILTVAMLFSLAGLVLACAAIAEAAAPECPAAEAGDFVPLFDGKTLAGWHTMPGGSWEVRDGVIVGTSPKGERRHGLLVSDKPYADFHVRLKFRVEQGNSGFYFRSEKVAGAVGVHGFQAEVDNSSSVGGLYETGGRAWVVRPPKDLIDKIYKPGEWNTMEVVACGRNVAVFLNGAKTTELTDDPGRLKGHLALQLHGGMDMDVAFKDIAIKEPSNAQPQ